jgi:hypothetical protein
MTTRIARDLGSVNPGANADQRLYRLSPPLERGGHEYVVASAVVPWFGGGPETMIFASTETGHVLDFEDLAVVRELNHEAAVHELGYEVIDDDTVIEGESHEARREIEA